MSTYEKDGIKDKTGMDFSQSALLRLQASRDDTAYQVCEGGAGSAAE